MSKKQNVARYRNNCKMRIKGIASNITNMLHNMPQAGTVTIEERNTLLQIRECINSMILPHWDIRTKDVINKINE